MAPPCIVLDIVSAMRLYEGVTGEMNIRIPDGTEWQQVFATARPGEEIWLGIEDSDVEVAGIVVELDEAASVITVVV